MKTHEGKMGGRLKKRARLVAAATALVSALALSAPAIAGAATYGSTSYRSYPSITITQNTAMIVDVSTLNLTMTGTVSWSDVSWSDVY
jgi:seryl-tRNA(Sec) selenium transferase